ncbi:hypothetical protein PCASD_22748 [Puccinia coronata f. sp. avenae]|uniref:Uncharacterized protein n=1 Tax=Puccinia coronata f. sp. avenae TaxID=200324 RepID=A0A2N5SAF2_9BASI|nr:hypothetical protein PCASD_22748 [Puccinia coronata f. sp. avenae]
MHAVLRSSRPIPALTRTRPSGKTCLRTFAFSSSSASPDHAAIEHASSWITQLSDLLISQPLQPLSYTTTVVLATIAVRSTTTLPVSIWARLRINRFERVVLPNFKAFRTHLALRAKRSFLDPVQIPAYQAHLQAQLKRELDRLISANRCRPSVTILGSLGIHVPVIYGLTTVLRTACERVSSGSPLAIEPSPLLGASLLEPDLALALVCWAAFLANVELNASFRYLRRSASDSPRPITKNSSFISRGLSFWTPEKIRSASFLAGVGMMGISSSQPALVLIYWLTSNCFSILQSLCFIYLDHRHSLLKTGPNDPAIFQHQQSSLTNSPLSSSHSQTPLNHHPTHPPQHLLKVPSAHPKSQKPPSSSLPPIL